MDLQLFYKACENGVICNVDALDQDTLSAGFRGACFAGHLNVVKWLISKGVNDPGGCSNASFCGRFDVVKYLVSQDMYDSNECFINACYGGHLQIAEFMISHRGVDRFDEGLYFAYAHNHFKIVEMLISNQKGLFVESNHPLLSHLNEKHVYALLEMGVLVETFSTNQNSTELLAEIQNFKAHAKTNFLISDLSKLIADYSLK